MSWTRFSTLALIFFLLMLASVIVPAQDASGSIRGTVYDSRGGRIAQASVVIVSTATGLRFAATSDAEGAFAFDLLQPGDYSARVTAQGMSPQVTPQLHVDVGAAAVLEFHLTIAGVHENVTVSGSPALVEPQTSTVSTLLDERAVNDFPLNGRRFSDLALFSPGVTQDPRSLTSATNGDLSFGGIRGFQNTTLVDGADFNNAFFAQARGRYRAPYQFSTEVVQEFRVSTNAYGAEQGRSGGAVINVVTKSGSNHVHGSAFYYLRDSSFGASNPFLAFKPHNRQQQVGGRSAGQSSATRFSFSRDSISTFSMCRTWLNFWMVVRRSFRRHRPGPIRREITRPPIRRWYLRQRRNSRGWLENIRRPRLATLRLGNSTLTCTPRHQLSLRLSTTRYWGANNVFLDPASPVTFDSNSNNGQEIVATETASVSLTSGLSQR